MNSKVKAFSVALACGLVFSCLASMAGFGAACDNIRGDVLRVHIRANSDSTQDQHLKLLVRDALVAESEDVFKGCASKEEALACLADNKERLLSAAQKTLAQNGADYSVKLNIRKENFETRVYENFTLPAGEYDALCVELGSAKGQNWWCVIFPTLCVGAASASESFSASEAEIITSGEKYKVKFKAIEIFEDIRQMLNF